jgi:hypothetical protein
VSDGNSERGREREREGERERERERETERETERGGKETERVIIELLCESPHLSSHAPTPWCPINYREWPFLPDLSRTVAQSKGERAAV